MDLDVVTLPDLLGPDYQWFARWRYLVLRWSRGLARLVDCQFRSKTFSGGVTDCARSIRRSVGLERAQSGGAVYRPECRFVVA